MRWFVYINKDDIDWLKHTTSANLEFFEREGLFHTREISRVSRKYFGKINNFIQNQEYTSVKYVLALGLSIIFILIVYWTITKIIDKIIY